MSVFQDLYDSEINFSVSCLWDGGFDVKFGDEMNGFTKETAVRRWGELEPWLIKTAIKMHPKSTFAYMYRDGMSRYRAREQEALG